VVGRRVMIKSTGRRSRLLVLSHPFCRSYSSARPNRMIAYLPSNEVTLAVDKLSKLVGMVVVALGICLGLNSGRASAGCEWLHQDGWYLRIHQVQRDSDLFSGHSSTGVAGGLSYQRVTMEYSEGRLRFRANLPAIPCTGPNCRSSVPVDSPGPLSLEPSRLPCFGLTAPLFDKRDPAPRCDWCILSDAASMSLICEPATPPPRSS
jgi:hypothetical protein